MKDLNLINFNKTFKTEQDCIDYLAKLRWNGEPICPHCGSMTVYTCISRPIYKCRDCTKQFTVRIGTIFEESRLPLIKWFYAIYLLTSQKKGISSIRLAEYLGITQKTAWFMLQRIRYALEYGLDTPLDGIVEMDETYIGGVRRGHKGKFTNKTAVMGMVERKKNGRIVTKVTKQADATVALPFIRASIKRKASLQTDESKIYHRVKLEFTHQVINHFKGEYSKNGVSTNTIEGAWNHLKLSLRCIYMHVSDKHLSRYCNEFEFRYNTRGMRDGERFENWFSKASGKRLTYKKLVA